ncbi:transcriptional regulator NarL [Roseovarius halotolerans]|uniref:Transcriptional regulator NarL n=2 Tax=Roseovarius halotolerans TaxID=505353 RepID=A0A1X6ZS87_9RHOB|nr:transcriptional regulator NarL [Roseovarius halotolerans]
MIFWMRRISSTRRAAELFVLRLAADGLTNKEIARDMNANEVTVKMHMRSICKKLGARNRAHAAMISRERALI